MNAESLLTLIRHGAGQGHRDDYCPIVRLSRNNIAKCGYQSVGPLPGYRRAAHLLSDEMRIVALLLLWLGALDVRENFPLWPFDHPHPLADWPYGNATLTTCVGMTQIRRLVKKSHPSINNNTSSLSMIDFMVTNGNSEHPYSLMVECRVDARSLHQVEQLQKNARYRYAIENGIRYQLIQPYRLNPTLTSNLDALSHAPNAVRRDVSQHDLPLIQDLLRKRLEQDAICNAVHHVASLLKADEQQVWSVFDAMAWSQAIDIDISKPIYRTESIITGGRRLKTEMQRFIFGER